MAQVQVSQALPLSLQERRKLRNRPPVWLIPHLSDDYNRQFIYLLQAYDPVWDKIVGVYPFRTLESLELMLSDLKAQNLWPLVSPNPVYVPKEFWAEYRRIAYFDPEATVNLAVRYDLLKDEAIYTFNLLVMDIDSPFRSVLPAWRELQELLSLYVGYRVFKTKSGRFRAYLKLEGTKDLKRAKELLAIIYAFFERKGLNPDPTFVGRLNHPVFYEDYPFYRYELIESVEGELPFYDLYRRVKKLQKKFKLWRFNGRSLTEEIWGKKVPKSKQTDKEDKILKAPAFRRKLKMERLDVEKLFEMAVRTLASKHSSYRYIHVIQPAIGWAKYLELDRAFVTELLVSLLGENKRKDVEKGWKYARELEFTVPGEVRWFGRKREDWEEEVISFLVREREIERQELIKRVFFNQKWLCDLIMEGLIEKGIIISKFVRYGRGRPKKVFALSCTFGLSLRKAVSFELTEAIRTADFKGQVKSVGEQERDFNHLTNSLLERVIGGGWKREIEKRLEVVSYDNTCSGGNMGVSVDGVILKVLAGRRLSFDLFLLSGRVVKDAWVAKFSEEKRKVVVSGEVFSFQDLASFNFRGKEAVRFYKEILPELPPSSFLDRFEGKTIYIYPYGASPEKWTLVRAYPYQFLLHRVERVRMPDGSVRKFHSYQFRYKLSLSAYTFFNPYPEELIKEGEPVGPHRAGNWREDARELVSYIKEEFKRSGEKELLLTLALKDGREITGVMQKYEGYKKLRFVLKVPQNPIKKIAIFKHAVDDFWME